MGCLDFLETANRKTLFVLSVFLLVVGIFQFFLSTNDVVISIVLGFCLCILAFIGIVAAWKKQKGALIAFLCFAGFIGILELLFVGFECIADEPSFPSIIWAVICLCYFFICCFFAYRVMKTEGYGCAC